MKKFQFGTGAITPVSQPVQFEYKPLGLEAFAQPLAAKQAGYDKVTTALEGADFGIDGLNPDDERSQAISDEITARKNELLESLGKTKNYKESAKKLQQLNTIYNKDAEIVGIKTQKAAFLAADEEAKKRIGKDGYTQKDYEEWRFKKLNEYSEQGGYNYDRASKSGNGINTDLRGKNLESEIMKISRTAANMEPENIVDYIQKNTEFAGVDGEALLTTIRKYKNKDDIANAITNHLKTSERYNNWVKEDGEYEFYNRSRKENGFTEGVINGRFAAIQDAKDELTKVLYDKKDAEGRSYSEDQLASVEEQLKDLTDFEKELTIDHINAASGSDQDKLDFAESIFLSDRMNNRLSGIAAATADLVDYDNITHSVKGATGGGAGARKKIEEIDNYKVDVQLPFAKTKNGGTTTPFQQGPGTGGSGVTGTSDSEFNKYDNSQQKLYADITKPYKGTEQTNAVTAIKESDQYSTLNTTNKAKVDNLYRDTDYAYSFMQRVNKWEVEKDKIDTEIIDLNSKLNTGTIEQKREIRAKLNVLEGDKREASISMEGEFHFLDNLFQEASLEKGNEWINESLKEGGRKQLYKDIFSYNNEILQGVKNDWATVENEQQIVIDKANVTSDPLSVPQVDMPILDEQQAYIDNSLNEKLSSSRGTEVFNIWRNAMAEKAASVPTEIIINKQSNNFTGNTLEKLKTYVEQNEAKTPTAAIPVTFDAGTGIAKTLPTAQEMEYDIKNYNEQPSYVGSSVVDGNPKQILRYNMAELTDSEIVEKIADSNYGGNTIKGRNQVKDEEVALFKRNNPTELFLSINGTSLDIEDAAEKTFTELGEAAMLAQNPYAYSVAASSFAAINLATNNDRRKDYGEMTTTLKNALSQEDSRRVVAQPPAHWNDNGDDTYSGYQLSYHYDNDKNMIVADVSMLTYGKGIEGTDVKPITTKDISHLNAQSIYAMDILYGVGNEKDLPVNPQSFNESPFVPAWNNAAFANNF